MIHIKDNILNLVNKLNNLPNENSNSDISTENDENNLKDTLDKKIFEEEEIKEIKKYLRERDILTTKFSKER